MIGCGEEVVHSLTALCAPLPDSLKSEAVIRVTTFLLPTLVENPGLLLPSRKYLPPPGSSLWSLQPSGVALPGSHGLVFFLFPPSLHLSVCST